MGTKWLKGVILSLFHAGFTLLCLYIHIYILSHIPWHVCGNKYGTKPVETYLNYNLDKSILWIESVLARPLFSSIALGMEPTSLLPRLEFGSLKALCLDSLSLHKNPNIRLFNGTQHWVAVFCWIRPSHVVRPSCQWHCIYYFLSISHHHIFNFHQFLLCLLNVVQGTQSWLITVGLVFILVDGGRIAFLLQFWSLVFDSSPPFP